MKATEMANKHRRTLSSKSRGTLTGSGLDLETKIFSASGRGRTFFLTSLFIELIDCREGAGSFRVAGGSRVNRTLLPVAPIGVAMPRCGSGARDQAQRP